MDYIVIMDAEFNKNPHWNLLPVCIKQSKKMIMIALEQEELIELGETTAYRFFLLCPSNFIVLSIKFLILIVDGARRLFALNDKTKWSHAVFAR